MKEKIHALKEHSFPFVLFRLPGATAAVCYFQQNKKAHFTANFSENGFVFAPFRLTKQLLFIPKENSFSFVPTFESHSAHSEFLLPQDQRESYLYKVNEALSAIKKEQFEKIVLSNVFTVSESPNPLTVFNRLAHKYPTAFIYYWFHPKTGEWLGASPERFLHLDQNNLTTMALAGTLTNQDENWSPKEFHEQQLVVDSIVTGLQTFLTLDQISVGDRETVYAGSLRHLCTRIEAKLSSVSLSTLVKELHPTPAVGGLPKHAVIQYILTHEDYDRSFYTGFLGPFSDSKQADFFVNLRCAEMRTNALRLYTGAGITAGSNPEKEWREICRKASTFLSVI